MEKHLILLDLLDKNIISIALYDNNLIHLIYNEVLIILKCSFYQYRLLNGNVFLWQLYPVLLLNQLEKKNSSHG